MTKSSGKKRNSKGKPENLRPFKPGQSGNPSGRKPIPLEEKQARQFIKDTNEELARDLITSGKYKAFLEIAIEASCRAGKMDGLKFLNDYNGNKPKESIEMLEPVNKYKELTPEELEVELIKRGLPTKIFDE